MVGVVGSSPIAPTKQNPLCWAVWKGSPKGEPFFVVCDLQNFCKTPTSDRQFGAHLNIIDRFVAVSLLIVLGQLLVRVAQQRLDVFLREVLLLLQPRSFTAAPR